MAQMILGGFPWLLTGRQMLQMMWGVDGEFEVREELASTMVCVE